MENNILSPFTLKSLNNILKFLEFDELKLVDPTDRDLHDVFDLILADLEAHYGDKNIEWPRWSNGDRVKMYDKFVCPEYTADYTEPEELISINFISPKKLEEWNQADGDKFSIEFNYFRAQDKDYRPFKIEEKEDSIDSILKDIDLDPEVYFKVIKPEESIKWPTHEDVLKDIKRRLNNLKEDENADI